MYLGALLKVHTFSLGHEEVPVLYPARRTRRGLRAWWLEHVTVPLDRMYAELDEHHHDDEQS